MFSASYCKHQTCRIYATIPNTATTTHCSSCSLGAHGPNTKVRLLSYCCLYIQKLTSSLQIALASTLPSLSPAQEHKLRLLTLLTLAANTTNNNPLTYTNLQSALSLDSPLALERLVTDAIYADLLTATLNPAQGIVAISSVAALRDLNPGSVTRMMASLDAWSGRCDDVLKELEAQMKSVMEAAERRTNEEAMRAEQVHRAEAAGKKSDDAADDAMEVDDAGQKLGGKKRGLGGLGLRKR